jgi:Ran GTPase-activating protein (RanGAP) involved in mRNA processing and transport
VGTADKMANDIKETLQMRELDIHLKNLHLNKSSLTDAGVKYIADGAAVHKELDTLDLTGNQLSVQSAKYVIDKLGRERGEELLSVTLTIAGNNQEAIENYSQDKNINVIISPAPNGP